MKFGSFSIVSRTGFGDFVLETYRLLRLCPVFTYAHPSINCYPHLRQQRDLLTSIPGIGDLTAFKLVAEIRDILAFDSAAQLAAFAGLTPRQHTSGSSVRGRSRLSKRGSARLRTALYFPAIVAQQHNPILAAFAQRLRAAGKPKLVIIGTVMRKLLHLSLVSSSPPSALIPIISPIRLPSLDFSDGIYTRLQGG